MKPMTEEELNKRLRAGDRKRLYYVTGNDEFSVNACCDAVTASLPGWERLRFDALGFDREALERAFFSFPLGGEGRVILVNNFKTGAMPKEAVALFEELLSDIPDFLTVILRNFVDGRFSVNKQLEQILGKTESAAVTLEQKSGGNAERAIVKMAEAAGAGIEPDAAKRLLELLGGDLMQADRELEKLAALSGYSVITEKQVERLTTKTAESGVFDIIGALERRNLRQALTVLDEMLRNKTEPLMITASLYTAFINLFRAKCAEEARIPESRMFDLFDYKKGDRKVSIAFSRRREYSAGQLSKILELLYRLDIDLKSSPVGRGMLLEEAVVRIASVREMG